MDNNRIEEFPRSGSVLYKLICEDEKVKGKTLKRYKKLNKYLILPLYRLRILPLFGFGKLFLILTTKGRISGKKRKTPLEYHRWKGVITVVSGRGEDADWLKNLRANPDGVSIRYGFRSFQPRIEFIEDEKEKIERIKWYVTKHPKVAKMLFGWNSKTDDLETANFSKLIRLITLIQFHQKIE